MCLGGKQTRHLMAGDELHLDMRGDVHRRVMVKAPISRARNLPLAAAQTALGQAPNKPPPARRKASAEGSGG